MLAPEQIASLQGAPVPDSGNRVSLAIDLAAITQRSVAASIGMSEPHLSDICRGRYSNLRLQTVQKLAAFFGCAIEDIFPDAQAVTARDEAAVGAQ